MEAYAAEPTPFDWTQDDHDQQNARLEGGVGSFRRLRRREPKRPR